MASRALVAITGSRPWSAMDDWNWPRLLRDAYVLFTLAMAVVTIAGRGPGGLDANAYWRSDLDNLYPTPPTMFGTYLYSPAIAQLIAPLTALPWLVFLAILTTANLAALWYLLGPWAFPALLVPVVSIELLTANINLIIAVAIVAGFRRPWTWSLVLLTKITPGIGLLWFAVRREWRSLAIALAATGCFVAISAVVAPHLWAEWFGWLFKYAGQPPLTEAEGGWYTQPFPVPRAIRFLIAAAIVVFGALTNRPQNVPIAAAIGQPDVWGFAIALGAVPLIDWSGWRSRLARWA